MRNCRSFCCADTHVVLASLSLYFVPLTCIDGLDSMCFERGCILKAKGETRLNIRQITLNDYCRDESTRFPQGSAFKPCKYQIKAANEELHSQRHHKVNLIRSFERVRPRKCDCAIVRL